MINIGVSVGKDNLLDFNRPQMVFILYKANKKILKNFPCWEKYVKKPQSLICKNKNIILIICSFSL